MCKPRINYETLNQSQKDALRQIRHLADLMLGAWDEDYLFDLFCEAEDIWNDQFPFESNLQGDDWWVTRRFNDCSRAIKEAKKRGGCNITVNLFGCTVQIDTINNH